MRRCCGRLAAAVPSLHRSPPSLCVLAGSAVPGADLAYSNKMRSGRLQSQIITCVMLQGGNCCGSARLL